MIKSFRHLILVVGLLLSFQAFSQDTDSDGISDGLDNCPSTANANQTDSDAVRGTSNIARGRPVYGNCGGGSGCPWGPPSRVVDGKENNSGSYWVGPVNSNGYVTIDLGAEYKISEIKILNGADGSSNNAGVSNYNLQFSKNNSNWTTKKTAKFTSRFQWHNYYFNNSSSNTARYIKLYAWTPFIGGAACIEEIRVYKWISDGIGDECDNCPNVQNADQIDTDGDGYGDLCDAFINDITEWLDTDGDGIGNNVDEDDDGDGYSDVLEQACGTDPLNNSNKPGDVSLGSAVIQNLLPYTLTGGAVTPTPVVTLNNGTVLSGSEYIITYTNNTEAGNATLNITGDNSQGFTGSQSKTFQIVELVKPDDADVPVSQSNYSTGGTYTLNGYNPNINYKAAIRVLSVSTGSNASIDVRTTTGLNFDFGYGSWTNISKVVFIGKPSNIEAALNSIELNTKNAPNGQIKLQVFITSQVNNTFFNIENGHLYRYFPGNTAWTTARANAINSNYEGETGYMTNITSSSEQNFVFNNVNATDIWIGLSDRITEGTYKWEQGPEAGQVASYAPWSPGEPNNYGNEDYIVTKYRGETNTTNNGWNDFPNTHFTINGYLVEYGTWSNPMAMTFQSTQKSEVIYTQTQDLADATISAIPDQVYTGSAILPPLTIKYNNGGTIATLIEGVDFNRSSLNNINTGTASITITGIGNYKGSRTVSFTIIKAQPVIGITDITKAYGDDNFTISASSSSTANQVITIDNQNIVSLAPGTLNEFVIKQVGVTEFTITQSSTINYLSASATGTITINKKDPDLGSFGPFETTYGDPPFQIDMSSLGVNENHTSSYVFTTSSSTIASISGSSITVNQAGESIITATLAGDTNHNAGSISTTLTVAKALAEIEVTGLPQTQPLIDFETLPLSATTNASTSVQMALEAGSAATLSGTLDNYELVSIGDTGVVTITFTVPETINYSTASLTLSMVVTKTNQQINLPSDFPSQLTFSEPLTLDLSTVSATSSLTVGIAIATSSSATYQLSGQELSITHPGVLQFTFSQPGDQIYNQAVDVIKTLTVIKGETTLTNFGAISVNSTASPISITPPTSNRSGAFVYESADVNTAIISGTTIIITGTGSTTITATQPANSKYNAATISTTLTIGKSDPTLNFSDLTKTYGDEDFNLLATSNSTGAITYSIANNTIATVSATAVEILKLGTTIITASQAANINFNSATATITLTVNPASIVSATLTSIADQTYTGNAITISPTVTLNNTTLVQNTDYSVSYQNNTNVGSATIEITGTGNYTGTTSLSFNINKADISQVSIASISSQPYSGNAVTISPTLTFNNISLSEGTDFTTLFSNNVEIGQAMVTITGIGNFKNSLTSSFTINSSLNNATISAINDQTYTGKAITVTPTVSIGDTQLIQGTDYSSSITNNTTAGTAFYTINGLGTFAGSKTVSFTILPLDISNAQISAIVTQTYTGNEITPTPSVSLNSNSLTPFTDFTISYANNQEVGTAALTITGIGNYIGSLSANFKIISNDDSDYDGVPDEEDAFPNDRTETKDTDGDGIGDNTDPDIDGDGIPNSDDVDQDGDGINDNGNDIDGDGINDANDLDIDGDGIPNDQDSDIDGDGITNAEDVDPDGDGTNDNGTDTDGDGINDANDPDIDGDGIPNEEDVDPDGDGTNDNGTDTDGDGINDANDSDIDGDGITNDEDVDPDGDGTNDNGTDTDGDGINDTNDSDIDGDGIPNDEDVDPDGDGTNDNGTDTDGDGINDANDSDIDGDGITNDEDVDPDGDGTNDNGTDTDGDGINDVNDPDIDGDGIPNDEDVDPDGDGTNDNGTDTDGDGVNDANDSDIDGDGILNDQDPDLDGDGILNEEDVDTDGDGINDVNDPDIDGDGTPNEEDVDPDGDGVNDNGTDTDGDGINDVNDPDIDGDGIPNEEDVDPDGDGVNDNGTDTDGDGINDVNDPDIDGDGIPNEEDVDPDGDGVNDNGTDTDGDGINDVNDPDIDGDGIPNEEDVDPDGDGVNDNGTDTDGDGINDTNDSDIDGDGIPNEEDVDPDGDGTNDNGTDTDGDGINDTSDPDIDNDGIPNEEDVDPDGDGTNDNSTDTDGDDINDTSDPDIDGDGIPNEEDVDPDGDSTNDNGTDTDGDGINDTSDPDIDNDGISNEEDVDPDGDGTNDNGTDTDGDGINDVNDPDIDGDGIPNEEDVDPDGGSTNDNGNDTDGDGINDVNDPDIDGDGIPNEEDVDPDGDGVNDNGTDTDGDGINDVNDPDIDGDGIPNEEDVDPDGDGVNDNGTDTDGDGINDVNDPDIDGDGIPNEEDVDPDGDGVNDNGTDTDGDGINDVNDPDIDGDGIPNEEDVDPDGDGVNDNGTDTDGDGINDVNDPDIDGDGIPNEEDVDPDGDGVNDNGTDTDGDGINDTNDPDDDNDGIPDEEDTFPLNPNENSDSDGDGIGDNEDPVNNPEIENFPNQQVNFGISPNGDGLNDTLELDFLLDSFKNDLSIYDTFGRRVYYAENYMLASDRFDGRNQRTGNLLPQGTYFFILNSEDFEGQKQKLQGFIYVNY